MMYKKIFFGKLFVLERFKDVNYFMNINEECLLSYLNNPKRLDSSLEKLTKFLIANNQNKIKTPELLKDNLLNV